MSSYNIYDLSVDPFPNDINCSTNFKYNNNTFSYIDVACNGANDPGLNMYNMNTCLTNTINHYTQHMDLPYNTSNTRKNNWVSLYNEQYMENTQLAVGIFVMGLILAKMIFFPIKIKM